MVFPPKDVVNHFRAYIRRLTASEISLPQQPIREPAEAAAEACFLAEPRHPKIRLLHAYWQTQRGDRLMPARADIDPIDFPTLLPHILMYNVDRPGRYTVRLVGEAVLSFVGKNSTGRPAGSCMAEPAAKILIGILDSVVAERAPKFRAGKAHWHSDKSHREFEACFLPLSADGSAVNVIFGAALLMA
jgi:hypothetical protein